MFQLPEAKKLLQKLLMQQHWCVLMDTAVDCILLFETV
jgi:hypothetical protein